MSRRWRLEKIKHVSRARGLLFRIAAAVLGLFFAVIVLAVLGYAPISMGANALGYTLGTSFGLQDLGTLVTPLLMTGLAAMIAMRVNLWNIGGEGQFYMGAWAAAGIGIYVSGPPVLVLLLMFLAGGVAGALWIALPAYAKARANVDEIITTLLMNFIAILWVGYFASGPWRDPREIITASSYKIQYALPEWFGIWNIGIFIVLIIFGLCWVLFNKTVWGYETTYVGANSTSANYAGIPAARRIMTTMLLSGAIAGVAGMLEVSGTVSRLQVGISSDFGYLGIVIAALAAGSYLGIIVAAVLMAILLNAGIIFETQGLSLNAVVALTGWLLLSVGIAQVAAGYSLKRIATKA
ncbi:MAG: ABC transporter permease [Blastopirellula sp.]|nr:MAG: ABC transporter permease [Blastopirellula sp.]